MHWIASSEKNALTETLEKRLWDIADPFMPLIETLNARARNLEAIIAKNVAEILES